MMLAPTGSAFGPRPDDIIACRVKNVITPPITAASASFFRRPRVFRRSIEASSMRVRHRERPRVAPDSSSGPAEDAVDLGDQVLGALALRDEAVDARFGGALAQLLDR